MTTLIEVGIFILLLMLSAFFSGAEAAFFSLKQSRLTDSRQHERILKLLSEPRRLLITILTGNTIVNTSMAFFAALITADIARKSGTNIALLLLLESIVVSITILLVSEITPKILAIRNSEQFSNRVAAPVRIVSIILYPVASLLYSLTHVVSKLMRWKKEELFDSEEELKTLADLGADRGTLKHHESEMIKSVFDYGETAVRKIMVPRTDIVAIEKGTSLNEALKLIRESRFSKFPVYDETLDRIEGILYAKDMLPYLDGLENGKDLSAVSREPFFVPESKQIDDLLRDFQQRRQTIAIVVDEYGGTAGLATLEDIVEEVVGEIQDEFDREAPLVTKTGTHQWLVAARIPVNDLEDVMPLSFPEEREYDTLGGFLLDHFGDIPSAKSATEYNGFRFEIRTLAENRIVEVLISRIEEEDD
ncbi:MAG TPA: HlyC/CorC family transporter [Candidatus Marinimicrobia bacterium]|nr:HlyC/CorC family transporter [Candidatus Neomarinimicrobiota bacterium]